MKIPAWHIRPDGTLEKLALSPEDVVDYLPKDPGFWADVREALLARYDYFERNPLRILEAIQMNRDDDSMIMGRSMFNGSVKIYRSKPGTNPPQDRSLTSMTDEELAAAGWQYVGNTPKVVLQKHKAPNFVMLDEGAFSQPGIAESATIEDRLNEVAADMGPEWSDAINKNMQAFITAWERAAFMGQSFESFIDEIKKMFQVLHDEFQAALSPVIEYLVGPLHDDDPPVVDRDPRAKHWESPKFQPKRRR